MSKHGENKRSSHLRLEEQEEEEEKEEEEEEEEKKEEKEEEEVKTLTIAASKLTKTTKVLGGRERIRKSHSDMRSQHTTRFCYQ